MITEAIYVYNHGLEKKMKFHPEAGAQEIAIVTVPGASAAPATLTY
jgi:phage tail protein X